jgi:hypothetical protein
VDGSDTPGVLQTLAGQANPAGSAVGNALNDQFTGILLTASTRGDLYNFGERGLAPGFVSKRYLLGTAPRPTFVPTDQGSGNVPEPASGVLAAFASVLLGLVSWRRR